MGLYDDEINEITSGDVNNVLYFQAKYEHSRLQSALKSRQPESCVSTLLPSIINLCKDVLKEYPNHKDVKEWLDFATTIQSKINPNATSMPWKDDFVAWNENSYEMSQRFLGLAKAAFKENQGTLGNSYLKDAKLYLGRCQDRIKLAEENGKSWSDEAKDWVKQALVLVDSNDIKQM